MSTTGVQPALEELGDSVHDLSLLTQEDIAQMQLKPLTARRLTAALKSSTLAPEGALLTSGDLTPVNASIKPAQRLPVARPNVTRALCVYTQPLSQAAIAVLDDLAHCNLSVHHRSRCCGVRWSDRLRQQKGSMLVV